MSLKTALIICILSAIVIMASTVHAQSCTDDVYEDTGSDLTNDTCYGVQVTGSQDHKLCDEDWAWFTPRPNATYRIETSNLTGGANTVLSLHENCGVAVASNEGFDGLESRIEWTSVSGNDVDIRVIEFDRDYSADAGYTLNVECIANCIEPDGIFADSYEDFPRDPDLAVIHPAVSNAMLLTYETFTISATAVNQGVSPADATTLRYYLSKDNIIDIADTQLGTDAVPGLVAGDVTSQDLAVPPFVPGGEGSYWVGACIDSVAGETNAGNQCSAGLAITVVLDSDRDRLPDIVETSTGVYVDLDHTGTDPGIADTDGDGIKDGDEVLGTLAGLDLPALGVSPVRKDLLLEYDWFDDSLCGSAHSHRPTLASIAPVVAAFANAPIANPGGGDGVNIINDYGQGGVFTGGNLINDTNGVIDGGVNGSEYKAHKAAHFAANRNGYFHYVMLPHRYNTDSGSSGQAELYGDDMIVSLVCYGTDLRTANTILHELGHNLSLRHGGNENCNYKPNYNSVMNYEYQFGGVDNNCTPSSDGVTDYSYGDRPVLDETALNELDGLCGPGNGAWDWDGGGTFDAIVAHNINDYEDEVSQCGQTLSTLTDFNDWDSLYFLGIGDADGRRLVPVEIISEQWVPEEAAKRND